MDFPDGSSLNFIVWTGQRSAAGTAVYDTAQYDLDVYDGSTEITWTPIQDRTLSIDTKRGKDAWNRRFRTGTAALMLDNYDGWFTADGPAQPGDLIWIRSIFYPPEPQPDQPIPDGTTWNGETGRLWEAHGDGLVWSDGNEGQPIESGVFYGRVDKATDIVRNGVDTTKISCVDMYADLAAFDGDAQPEAGTGESAIVRVQRILSNVGTGFTVSNTAAPFEATMQATTLASQALGEIQLTMDSEGGDSWARPGPSSLFSGVVELRGRDWLTTDWRSTQRQWLLGGADVPLLDGRVEKDLQRVVNDVTAASVGGTAQNATSDVSITEYGRRTWRRLDLVCQGDTQPFYLAGRAVNNLSQYRPRVQSVTVNVEDSTSAEFGQEVEFGDLTEVLISSMRGWSRKFAAHVIGIYHSMWHDQWTVTVTLDDAFIENVDGPYSYLEYSEAFSLGGHP